MKFDFLGDLDEWLATATSPEAELVPHRFDWLIAESADGALADPATLALAQSVFSVMPMAEALFQNFVAIYGRADRPPPPLSVEDQARAVDAVRTGIASLLEEDQRTADLAALLRGLPLVPVPWSEIETRYGVAGLHSEVMFEFEGAVDCRLIEPSSRSYAVLDMLRTLFPEPESYLALAAPLFAHGGRLDALLAQCGTGVHHRFDTDALRFAQYRPPEA